MSISPYARAFPNIKGIGDNLQWDRVLAWWYDPVINPLIAIVVGNLQLAIELAQKPGSQVAYRNWLDDPNVPGKGDDEPNEIIHYGLERYIGEVADHAPDNVLIHLGNELNPDKAYHHRFLFDCMELLARRWPHRHAVMGNWGMGAFEDDHIWYNAPPTLPGGNHVDEAVRGLWLSYFLALSNNPYWHDGYHSYFEGRPQVYDLGYQNWIDGRPERWHAAVRSAGYHDFDPPLTYVFECGPDSGSYSELKGWRNNYIFSRGRDERVQADVDVAAVEFADDMLTMMRYWSEKPYYRAGAMFYWNSGPVHIGEPTAGDNEHAAFELTMLPSVFLDTIRSGILAADDDGGEPPPEEPVEPNATLIFLEDVKERRAPSTNGEYVRTIPAGTELDVYLTGTALADGYYWFVYQRDGEPGDLACANGPEVFPQSWVKIKGGPDPDELAAEVAALRAWQVAASDTIDQMANKIAALEAWQAAIRAA